MRLCTTGPKFKASSFQRVERYEISGDMAARDVARQLHRSAIVQRFTKSLTEEEMAINRSTRSRCP
jgi:ferritin-like metal-binding protein YciE